MNVGALVWQQMWSPGSNKTVPYGRRRLMRITHIIENYNGPGITRWCLADPARPNDEHLMSYVESDWCDLELAAPTQTSIFDLLDTQ
ncbi:hypothetical protein GCM10023259_103520 [Thermocatellispora tengchongensis]|uniref:Uncharacterized protein n=1 Tax=Arthrobacter ginkgonis TaxID=1630594 RepID=A0ABP7DKW8_9MICC